MWAKNNNTLLELTHVGALTKPLAAVRRRLFLDEREMDFTDRDQYAKYLDMYRSYMYSKTFQQLVKHSKACQLYTLTHSLSLTHTHEREMNFIDKDQYAKYLDMYR